MNNNKKSFLVTIVEASFFLWVFKAVASGLIQAFVFCLAKKKLEDKKD